MEASKLTDEQRKKLDPYETSDYQIDYSAVDGDEEGADLNETEE